MKYIPGFKENYSITKCGIIISHPKLKISPTGVYFFIKERVLKQKTDKYGYLIVCLRLSKKSYYKSVHRLMALTYFGESDLTVNHIDRIKTNNNISNLEYMTRSENSRDGQINNNSDIRGEKNPMSKLNAIAVNEIRKNSNPKKDILYAKKYKVSHKTIEAIRNKRSWTHLN